MLSELEATKEYVVLFEWTGNNYSAYVPDLPGCVACDDTLEATQELMNRAIALYVEALKEDGLPIPEPNTKAKQVIVAVHAYMPGPTPAAT